MLPLVHRRYRLAGRGWGPQRVLRRVGVGLSAWGFAGGGQGRRPEVQALLAIQAALSLAAHVAKVGLRAGVCPRVLTRGSGCMPPRARVVSRAPLLRMLFSDVAPEEYL